jgi:hypothetical protein
MKCSVARFVNTGGSHNGKPLVIERTWKARGAAAVVMRNLMKRGDANLTIAPVMIDGVVEYGIVRTSHNGL